MVNVTPVEPNAWERQFDIELAAATDWYEHLYAVATIENDVLEEMVVPSSWMAL